MKTLGKPPEKNQSVTKLWKFVVDLFVWGKEVQSKVDSYEMRISRLERLIGGGGGGGGGGGDDARLS